MNIKATKVSKDLREEFFDKIKQARDLAAEIFGSPPSFKTVMALHERVFLIGMPDEDENVKPGKLSPTQQNMVEDLAACFAEVEGAFGNVPPADRPEATFALYDLTYGPDYLDDEDDLDEDDE